MLTTFRVSGLAGALAFALSLAFVPPASAQSTQAHIYVQSTGPAGPVYGYTALSNGTFTAISGSPFKPGTKIVGGTNSRFYTIGKTLLHSYAVGSNGALGAQLSQVPFLNYAGASCSNSADQTGGPQAVLDHTGKSIYVLLQGDGNHLCSSYQTYNVNSDGSFTFNGDTQVSVQSGGYTTLPSILGNEKFAYADNFVRFNNQVIGFQRESTGTLQYNGLLNPTFSGSENYTAYNPDASPTENFVVLREFLNDSGFPQLGSFSVGANGTLTSTNTSSNMPQTNLNVTQTAFSPDGVFFAVAGDNGGNPGSGLKLYMFNGASPLTLFENIVTDPIDQVAWDNSGHLYAISTNENKLFIYTVTSQFMVRSATYTIPAPLSLVVVSSSSASCGETTVNAVNVCSPSENSTVSSPVQINAAANMNGGVYRFELWSGSTKLISVPYSGVMNQQLSLAPGTYHLIFVARNTAGQKATATRDITVK